MPDSVNTHESALDSIPDTLQTVVKNVANALNVRNDEWNLIKFYKRDFKIAFLAYPSFDDYTYRPLRHSISVDLQKLSHPKADYFTSENPPILHRKETFVHSLCHQIEIIKAITAEGEVAGLYANTRTIGFKKNC